MHRKPKPRGRPSPYRPHPWHGLDLGPEPPEILNAFIEITPFDLMKYEVDKVSGYMHVDRPQRTSSQPPALYDFVRRTFCDERVRWLAPAAAGWPPRLVSGRGPAGDPCSPRRRGLP